MKKLLLITLTFALFGCGNSSQATNTNKNDSVTMNAKPINLTKAEFLTKVANYEATKGEFKYLGEKPAIIDFYATWCGPCKAVAPILDDLAKEYQDQIVIYKIDTDKEPELSAAFGIQSIPTILFVPLNGQPQMVKGALPKSEFKKAVEDILLKK